jgi:hypothetical protein
MSNLKISEVVILRPNLSRSEQLKNSKKKDKTKKT